MQHVKPGPWRPASNLDKRWPQNNSRLTLKLSGVQVITVQGGAGVDTGDLDEVGVAELFGKTSGFKAGEPNVEAVGTPSSVETDDF